MAAIPIFAVVLFIVFDPFEIGTALSGNFSALTDDPVPGTLALLALWCLAAVHAKRLHDRDRSAWWLLAPLFLLAFCALLARGEPPRYLLAAGALITLVPTIWLIAEAGFRPGSEGENRFGPVPVSKFPAAKPHKVTGGEMATAAIKGILWSPLGILVILPLQLIRLLLLPVRQRHVFFGVDGRIKRARFWGLTAAAFLLALVFDTLPIYAAASLSGRTYDQLELSPALKPFHLLITALAAWSLAAIGTKRLHDRNHSGWWMVVFSPFLGVVLVTLLGPNPTMESILDVLLLPTLLLAAWVILQLGFLKGTAGPNRFGPDPIAPPQSVSQSATP